MLEQINASLQPVVEDFDRYWTWQHRKARLETELREIEAELEHWQAPPSQPQIWWTWLKGAGWIGELLLAINQEVSRLLDEPPHRVDRVEYLLRSRRMLQQQIELLARQMRQNGDPSEVYQELIELKQEILIQQAHPHGLSIRRIQVELHAQERHLALLDESTQAAHNSLRTMQTLLHTVVKERDTDLIINQRHLFPDLRRPYHYRLRRSLHLTQTSLTQLAELVRQHPDYEVFPPELQVTYFESFQRQFQQYLSDERLIVRHWQVVHSYCYQTRERLEEMLSWMQRGVEAIEQRHTFLLRKQERLVREAE